MSKNFEETLKKLNTLVERMEKGGLSLEGSLKDFEEGVKLIRSCQKTLTEARQKIEIYNKEKEQLDSFNDDESHE
jgi:exodeoxyribonuclease VII small subunit